jgi:UDP-2,3-diacylglucosamine pyrophosphatase LpxH
LGVADAASGRRDFNTGTRMALERELATYAQQKNNLLADEGKFVVIHGDTVVGTYTSYEDAVKVGYEKCGLRDFLVKKIESAETVHWFTRELDASCPS